MLLNILIVFTIAASSLAAPVDVTSSSTNDLCARSSPSGATQKRGGCLGSGHIITDDDDNDIEMQVAVRPLRHNTHSSSSSDNGSTENRLPNHTEELRQEWQSVLSTASNRLPTMNFLQRQSAINSFQRFNLNARNTFENHSVGDSGPFPSAAAWERQVQWVIDNLDILTVMERDTLSGSMETVKFELGMTEAVVPWTNA